MSKPTYVYVTYIASTPEKIWNALRDPELTRLYWFSHRNVSDWQIGSRWEHQDYDDPAQVHLVGRVLESERPTRLVVSWAYPADDSVAGKHSRVTFEIAPYGEGVRLTVTHDELEPGSEMEQGITFGWPLVLSNLKTLMETGRPLPIEHMYSEAPAQR
jgi:uncharacterized protein YndB with AHSA1/START domain